MILGADERRLALGALLHRGLDGPALAAALDRPLDWPALLLGTRLAGTSAHLWLAAQAAGAEERVPAGLGPLLRAEVEWNAARNAGILATAGRLTAALAASGVEALSLKGTALVALEPDYRPLRRMADLDLLVRREDLDRADAALAGAGLACTGRPPDHLGRGLAETARLDEAAEHLVVYQDAHGTSVELHHDLPGAVGWRFADLAGLFGRARSVAVQGRALRVPADEDLLGMTARHVLEHHHADPFMLPRLVADVELLLARGVDVGAAAGRYGPTVARAVALHARTRRLAERPSRLGLAAPERCLSPGWRALERPRLAALTALSHRRAVLAGFRRRGVEGLLPPRAFMASRYGVSERSAALPLLYGWRAVTGIARLLRGR